MEMNKVSTGNKYDEWCVEDAARTLMRAEEIKADPKMMKLVKEKLASQKKSITSIQGLKDARNKMMEEDDTYDSESDESDEGEDA